METIEGNWIMHGLTWDDPNCLHSVHEAIAYINDIGFLPLYESGITGFSLEEHVANEGWFCEDEARDPWLWRAIIARQKDIVFGKFFGKKTGFISRAWVPAFANVRRDGYDFDALYEDGKASYREKKIMKFFMEENQDAAMFSNDLKLAAGFGKGGEKGYENTITNLMMKLYLCNCDFQKRHNKLGEEFGWPVAVYSSIEHIYGYEHVTSCYHEDPKDSAERIIDQVMKKYPWADEKIARKVCLRA